MSRSDGQDRLGSQEVKSNVVIIDDDVLVRQALRDCVESAGYSVEASLRPRSLSPQKAVGQGASGFLSKPFRREDLFKILGAAIGH